MYYPYNRQYQPPPVYQPFQYRPSFFHPYGQHYHPQSPIYGSYNGFQIPRVNAQPAHPMVSQSIQSPNKNFQSPVRGFASPSRNQLMQSQQQPQPKPSQQQHLQSPTRPGYLTYEQVMERIQKSNSQQQQQSLISQQKSTSLPQPQQKSQPLHNQTQQQQPKAKQDNELQPTRQQQTQQNKTPNKQVPQQQEVQAKKETPTQQLENEEADEEIEELALQYEDGYIYRGQGYPPQTRSGFGTLTDSEGQEVYTGYWKDNFYEGEGKLNNLQVEQLEGAYDYTNMTNIGNGWLYYEGKFEGGKMHGQGTLILSNDEKYIGQFDDGMIHGDGEYITLEQAVIQGRWNQGILEQY